MLSISSSAASFLQSHADVNRFSDRLEQNKRQESSSDTNNNKTTSTSEPAQELAKQRQLQALKIRDREVKAHELAHASAGGQYASGANFTYHKGADGVLYAVAGEVSISASSVPNDPRATLDKAQTIQRAALAPANPSAQDRSVATSASAMAQNARIKIAALLQIERISEQAGMEDGNKSEKIDILI